MNPPPPLVTRPDQLGPYTTLVRVHRADPARTPDGARGGPVAPRARAGPATGSWHEPMRVTESHLRKWSLLQVSNGSCAVGMAMAGRSEEHTSELQSLMRISYAVFCLKKKKTQYLQHTLYSILSRDTNRH